MGCIRKTDRQIDKDWDRIKEFKKINSVLAAEMGLAPNLLLVTFSGFV